MANFELKLRQDATIMTNMGNLSRELPNLPPGFIIQLSVHQQNSNPLLRPPISKPVLFFYVLDTIFLSYHGMLHFLSSILVREGIQVRNDGRFLSLDNWLQLNASMPQSGPIYTATHLAECVLNYARWMRNNSNIRHRFFNIVPIAIDLTINNYQQLFQSFDHVDETFILESLPVINRNSTMAPAVRLVEGMIEASCTKNCSICLERFEVGQLISSTPCAHIFHKNCIAPWIMKSRSCPLCRADLSIHC